MPIARRNAQSHFALGTQTLTLDFSDTTAAFPGAMAAICSGALR